MNVDGWLVVGSGRKSCFGLHEIFSVFCILLWLNPGVQGEHLTSQLPWVATLLLVTRVCPVYLVDELVLVVRSDLCMV